MDVCSVGWYKVDMGGVGQFKVVAGVAAATNMAKVEIIEASTGLGGAWPQPGQWTGGGAGGLEPGQTLLGVRFCGTPAGWGDPANAMPYLTDAVKSFATPYVAPPLPQA